ncbi:MAG TPA: polysaccharide biosynthesis/export family protein [Rhizomicrobium sp.]|nr:polysaccharide biosynthesis/export family protein [Rhizomicrobium sp.]
MAISRKPLYAVILCSMVLGVSACATGPIGGSADALKEADNAAQEYRLASGDKVHIEVFGENNLSGDYIVAPDGNITLPLAGQVAASGQTIPQLRQSVVTTLSHGYVQDPNVTISSVDLRPFYILGEVNKPGRYSYEPNLTVMAAVATAQGFTYRADMSDVYIRHARDASEKQYDLTSTLAVQPGDTIRISERYF